MFVLEFGLAWRAKDGSLTVKLGSFSWCEGCVVPCHFWVLFGLVSIVRGL